MGRGRQKAKQTKVARQLKYFSPDTDYSALQRELAHTGEPHPQAEVEVEEADDVEELDDESTEDDVDEYASWAQPPR